MINPVKKCLVIGHPTGDILPIGLAVRKHPLQVVTDRRELVQSPRICRCLDQKSLEDSLNANAPSRILEIWNHGMHLAKLLDVLAEPGIEQLIGERRPPLHRSTRLWRISCE